MQLEQIGSLEIVKYDFQQINGEPKIVISMIKVLDQNGDYVKFAKLKDVEAYLAKFPIRFKEKK